MSVCMHEVVKQRSIFLPSNIVRKEMDLPVRKPNSDIEKETMEF